MVFLRGTLTNPLMSSVQRVPIDFSGDGLVGNITPARCMIYDNNRFSMTYDGGYLTTFFTPQRALGNFFLLFFFIFFSFFFPFLTPPDPPKSAPKWGSPRGPKKSVKKRPILTRKDPPFWRVGRPNVHHSPLSLSLIHI